VASEDQAQAVEAFREVVEQEDQRVAVVERQVDEIVTAAEGMQVRNAAEAQAATEFLASIARGKRSAEDDRLFLTRPLREHVARINQRFKDKMAPVDRADGIVREKLLAFNREQERLREEEERRIRQDRERREREAEEARRQQEAEARARAEEAARDAERKEAEARKARQERATALDQEMAELSDEALTAASNSDDPERREAAEREGSRRISEREAREARERADQAMRDEQQVRDAPLPDVPETQVVPTGPTRSASGSASTRKTWRAIVTDPAKVPDRFKVVDEPALRRHMHDTIKETGAPPVVPGVKFEQETGLAVRAR
jgi:hypothetical protein